MALNTRNTKWSYPSSRRLNDEREAAMRLRQMIQEEAEQFMNRTLLEKVLGRGIVGVLALGGSLLLVALVGLYGGVMTGVVVVFFRMGYAWVG